MIIIWIKTASDSWAESFKIQEIRSCFIRLTRFVNESCRRECKSLVCVRASLTSIRLLLTPGGRTGSKHVKLLLWQYLTITNKWSNTLSEGPSHVTFGHIELRQTLICISVIPRNCVESSRASRTRWRLTLADKSDWETRCRKTSDWS